MSADPTSGSDPAKQPRHLTREPWWLVPLCGAIAALAPLYRYGSVRRLMPDTPLWKVMVAAGGLGLVSSTVLVARSHVRSLFWSNVALWGGIFLAALGVSGFLAFASR